MWEKKPKDSDEMGHLHLQIKHALTLPLPPTKTALAAACGLQVPPWTTLPLFHLPRSICRAKKTFYRSVGQNTEPIILPTKDFEKKRPPFSHLAVHLPEAPSNTLFDLTRPYSYRYI